MLYKCCIYCFVIQLLSEPDKQNFWYSLFKVRLRYRLILSAFSGHTWPIIKTKIQNCLELIYFKMRETLVKEKTLHPT